jgi:hypothetical protein
MKSILFLTLAGSAAAFAPAQQVCYFCGIDGALIDFCDLKTMEIQHIIEAIQYETAEGQMYSTAVQREKNL